MQSIAFNFDVTNIDPYVGGARVYPSGQYLMAISNMECKENNDKSSGHNLRLEYTILDGEHKGGKYYENLNLWHTGSTAAQEIAYKQLSSIGHAVGVLSGTDLTMLANKPMLVELDLVPAKPGEINQNTGERGRDRPESNRVVRRDPVPAAGAAPASAPINVTQAASAPPMQAAQQAAAAAPAQAASANVGQQAPAFNGAAAAPAPAAGPAAAAVPPWQK